MSDTLVRLIAVNGYAVLFVLVMLESMGIPLPGETALIAAAAYASTGHLSIVGVIIAAAAGGIVGDSIAYWIGRRGGLPLLVRHGKRLHIDGPRLERAREFFERHGDKTVFLGRFIALLRIWAALLAGVARMPYARFMAYNALGAACWSAATGGLAYWFANNLSALHRGIHEALILWLVPVVLTFVVVLGFRWTFAHHDRVWARTQSGWKRVRELPPVRALARRYPHALAGLRRRLTPSAYLGVHLTAGLFVSLFALAVFALIARAMRLHEHITTFDAMLANTLHRHATHAGVIAFRVVATFGLLPTMFTLSLTAALIARARGRALLFRAWVFATVGASVLDPVLKHFFHRPRPWFADPVLTASGWSFPSGHAMDSLVGYGMLAYLLCALVSGRGARIAIVTGATIMVLLIGFSRLYLGVHYFSDVIGGYAAGAMWLAACVTGTELARRHVGERTSRPSDVTV